ncbi:MAG: DUF2877 domain-containing protein [Gammaproteobacteria bacterium]
MAVFRRSFYLQSAAGDCCCLGPVELGNGPLNALCALPAGFDWRLFGLRPGIRLRLNPNGLRIADHGRLSLDTAHTWSPPPLPDWRYANLANGLAVLGARLERQSPGSGLAPLIPGLAAGEFGIQAAVAPLEPLLRPAIAPLAALVRWLEAHLLIPDDGGAVPHEAASLLGLGPGLTPSGDDFVGGMMIALRVLGRATSAARLGAWALALAREHTNVISYGHLRCAAAGAGAEALHEVLIALCAGASGLDLPLQALNSIGHSSGWDALAGAVAVCRALIQKR